MLSHRTFLSKVISVSWHFQGTITLAASSPIAVRAAAGGSFVICEWEAGEGVAVQVSDLLTGSLRASVLLQLAQKDFSVKKGERMCSWLLSLRAHCKVCHFYSDMLSTC